MTSSPILYCQVYLNPGGINMIKNKDGKDLREAEEIRKKWQEYTYKLYKYILMTWITTMVWSLTQSKTSWSVKSSGP